MRSKKVWACLLDMETAFQTKEEEGTISKSPWFVLSFCLVFICVLQRTPHTKKQPEEQGTKPFTYTKNTADQQTQEDSEEKERLETLKSFLSVTKV